MPQEHAPRAIHSLVHHLLRHTRCVSDTHTYGGGNRCNATYNATLTEDDPDSSQGRFTCSNMGISSGCSDMYHNKLDCQWIDITDLPDGQYWLTVRSRVRKHYMLVYGLRPPHTLYTLFPLAGGHQLARGYARDDLTRERLQQQRSQCANPDRRR